jgi:hypothetical protein
MVSSHIFKVFGFEALFCDWAKKIRKARQVWFNTKEEAREKGFKAHDCVQ